MSGADRGAAQVRRLLAEVRADRTAVGDRTNEVREFCNGSAADFARHGALALALDRAYTALEALLEPVVVAFEGELDAGADWHRQLLRVAGLQIDKVRPAVLGPRSLDPADELRRFRHFLRHAYPARLDPAKIERVAQVWLGAFADLQADLHRLEDFLEGVATRLEGLA